MCCQKNLSTGLKSNVFESLYKNALVRNVLRRFRFFNSVNYARMICFFHYTVTVQFSPNLENSTDYMIVNLQNKIAILLDLTLLN